MIKKILAFGGSILGALCLLVGLTPPAAAALPSATSTIDDIGTVVIATSVSWIKYFFTNYFSWVIGVLVLGIIVGIAYKMLHKSTGHGK
jgi:hypothetical protein